MCSSGVANPDIMGLEVLPNLDLFLSGSIFIPEGRDSQVTGRG
jgi:hypothetical protein